MRKIDLMGKRFGRLVVIAEGGKDKDGSLRWICKCDCGNTTKPILSANLRKGHVKSCGRLLRKHGKKNTRLYEVWRGMKKRCSNKNHFAYKYYGARGISVCDEWKNDFSKFYDWAMLNGYNPDAPRGECTIDRINNNGNYEPSNCRWITMAEQEKNRRTHREVKIEKIIERIEKLNEKQLDRLLYLWSESEK